MTGATIAGAEVAALLALKLCFWPNDGETSVGLDSETVAVKAWICAKDSRAEGRRSS